MDYDFFYLGQEIARIFLYVTGNARIGLNVNQAEITPAISFSGPGNYSACGLNAYDVTPSAEFGIYSFELAPCPASANTAHNAQITVSAEGPAAPFLLPRPGVTPSHFPGLGAPLWLGPSRESRKLWIPIPEALERILIHTIHLHHDTQNPVRFRFDKGKRRALAFNGTSHHRGAPLECSGKVCELEAVACDQPYRVSTAEGLPIFLCTPPEQLPFGSAETDAETEAGRDAARIDFLWRDTPVSTQFVDEKQKALCFVLPGTLRVSASRGFFYNRRSSELEVKSGSRERITIRLSRILERPVGYVAGDCHMHSWTIDGAHCPETIAASARAESLDFIFLTDDDPDKTRAVEQFSVEGEFLAMGGQEAHCEAWHINLLGVLKAVRDASWGNPNITAREAYDAAMARSSASKPVGVMLNHPHFSGAKPHGASREAYFYSWHVLDEVPEISAVENFNFEGWFEQLNKGRRVAAVWTTDSHDAILYPVGARRTFCKTDGELTQKAIIKSLLEGRSFIAREPGDILLLQIDDAEPGDTLRVSCGQTVSITVECRADYPIASLEIVHNGAISAQISGDKGLRVTLDMEVEQAGWIIARVKLDEPPLCPSSHESEPLTQSGYAAFTNPVYIEIT